MTTNYDARIVMLWGKTGRRDGQPTWHPLLCHMLDAASVALALWESSVPPAWRRWMSRKLGLAEAAAGVWCAFCVGCHDIGKASPVFQTIDSVDRAMGAGWAERLRQAGLPVRRGAIPWHPHGLITTDTLPQTLDSDFGLDRRLALRIAAAVGGHHGTFSDAPLNGLDLDAVGQGDWTQVRRSMVTRLAALLRLPRDPRPASLDNSAALALAGLTSVSDWIGSNSEFFHHEAQGPALPSSFDIEDYARRTADAARKALEDLGWAARPRRLVSLPFADVFPKAVPPYPVQAAAERLADVLDEGPALVIVEAPTGEGKTEAALYLADRRAADGGQSGWYVALPTQATSNQMFTRAREFLTTRHPAETVNLQLLHGHASLLPEFEQLRRDADQLYQPEAVYGDADHGSTTAQVLATEWFTHRKRGLLAPFGVGTVDQALLAVLRTRHVFVRLFALSGKCVVIDEVHAYDTYMSTLLGRLLEWLAALGTTVILLSATLPRSRRLALMAKYGAGLDRPEPPAGGDGVAYPRITWASSIGSGEVAFEPAERSVRTIRVEHLANRTDNWAELGVRLQAALADGGCAVLIWNTVARAQEAYQRLQPFFPGRADDGGDQLDLFHARFPFEERIERECRTLVRFGKNGAVVTLPNGTSRQVLRPHKAVLIATQVVEQSLDLDFDLLITELAPADLIAQRAGRLHRHDRSERPATLRQPTMWLISPAVEVDLPSFGASAKVYDEHVLLRSWLALRGRARIDLPGDTEALIEAVYEGDDPPHDLPPQLTDMWTRTLGKRKRECAEEQSEAQDRWLKPPHFGGALSVVMTDPLEEEAPDIHEKLLALTRLTEPSVQVVALWRGPDGLRLEPDGGLFVDLSAPPPPEVTRRLLFRAATLADKRVVFALRRQPAPPGWKRSPLLRHHRVLELDKTGRAYVGKYVVELRQDLGFRVLSDKEV